MVLVGTNLLVFALMAREGHLTPETTASVRTLRSAGQIAVSAMSWLEVGDRRATPTLKRFPMPWKSPVGENFPT